MPREFFGRKKRLPVLFGFWLGLAAGVASAEDAVCLSEDLTVRRLEPDVYLVVHAFPWPANALFVLMPDSDAVLVDTPYTDEATERLIAWIREELGELRIRAINTHFHRDNLGGNGALIRRGIPVYGSDRTARLLEERSDVTLHLLTDPGQARYLEALRNSPLTPPDRLFGIREGLLWRFGDDSVSVFYPGPGHSEDNVVVYFSGKRILFGGCLVKSLASRNPGFTGDADMEAWPGSLRNLLDRCPRARVVIPGHGEPGDLSLVRHTLGLAEIVWPAVH
ncbi:MAG TPA: subclass B1 metallo-beta-lactamase [bacterium]|nr:subclass B1 metallo-beta-lactamase [bacterium]